jgi:DNA primase large subunit
LKNTKKNEEVKEAKEKFYEIPQAGVAEKFFPPCIKILSQGIQEDGKKRALFILLNFLRSIGYNESQIEKYIFEWNKRNRDPLKDNYIIAQLSWHKRQEKSILPPNCPKREENVPLANQQNYYTDLQICKPDDFCKVIKNPVNYAIKKQRLFGNK